MLWPLGRLPDQAVGVFVGSAFPRVVRRREIKPGVGRAFDGGVPIGRTHHTSKLLL